jgi:hypothetical protein
MLKNNLTKGSKNKTFLLKQIKMINIKKFKSNIALILTITFLLPTAYSCSSDNVVKSERTFDFTTFNEGIKVARSLPQIDYTNYKTGKTIDKINLTNEINNLIGNDVLNSSVFDFSHSQKNSAISTLDIEILESFTLDWKNIGIDQAIVNLSNTLNEKNVDDITFDKYNKFSNVLLLTEIDLQNPSDNNYETYGWGCAIAIAVYTLRTVAVGTTCIPNPVTIYACPLAISFAVLGYAAMIVACTD